MRACHSTAAKRIRYLGLGFLIASALLSRHCRAADCPPDFRQPRFLHTLPGSTSAGQHIAPAEVTVVLMNWLRPDNVRFILSVLDTYDAVGEVLVVMNNPDTRFEVNATKAQALDFSALEATWGLTSRFKACLLARSPYVLVLDDDLLITEQGLDRLLDAKAQDSEHLVGYHARSIGPGGEYTAPPPDSEGLFPIVLTKALLLDMRFCHAFFQLEYLMADLANASHTLWNAEDIYMSLVATKMTGEQHMVLAPTPDDLIELADEFPISQRPGHYSFRTTFLQAALERLACVQTGGLIARQPAPGTRELTNIHSELSIKATARRRPRRMRLTGTLGHSSHSNIPA